jgi:hypothetical protein
MNSKDLFSNRKLKFGFASFIGVVFMGFIAGWVFLVPISAAAFLIYGYVVYTRDQKHKINVNYKPNDAMRAIVRRELELKNEKERIISNSR